MGAALKKWKESLPWPDEEMGTRLELHDGEAVKMPPPRPVDIYLSARVLAHLTNIHLEACRTDDSIVDAPPFILETLSPPNGRSKIVRQRLAAFSGDAREFWVVDPSSRTMEAFALGKPWPVYGEGEEIAMSARFGAKFPVGELFRD